MKDYANLKDEIDAYLAELQITATVQKIGDACPPFCEDKGKPGIGKFPRKTHIHGQHYQLMLSRGGRSIVIDFWNSYHDAELLTIGSWKYRNGEVSFPLLRSEREAIKVRPADVLSCVELNFVGSFEEFCSDYGYDEDSRKAEATYHAVCNQRRDLCKIFSAEELEALAEKVGEL